MAFYRGKTVVVTGAGGFLGTNLVHRLRNEHCQIVCVSRGEPSPSTSARSAGVEHVRGDVRKRETWQQALDRPDVVFHLAAQTSARIADEQPAVDVAANLFPLIHLLETCRIRQWKPVVVLASTVTIAGIPTTLPLDERHADVPLTAYDVNKLAAEQYLASFVRRGFVHGVSLRLPNVYGPGRASTRTDRGVLNQMIARAARGEALTVYEPSTRLRDYVFVDDAIDAFLRVPSAIDAVDGRHVLVGTGQGHSLGETMQLVAAAAARRTGVRPRVDYVTPSIPQSPIEARDCIVDASLLRRATGWQAAVDLPAGIERTMNQPAMAQ